MGLFPPTLSPKQVLNTSLKGVLNLFLTTCCPLCDRTAAQAICPNCCKQLAQVRLARPLDTQSPLPVLAWGAYQGSLRQAIALLKYDQRPEIAHLLGRYLGQCWPLAVSQLSLPAQDRPVVVPIPLHPTRQQARGFNQAELLAQGFCQETGLPLAAQGLQRTRDTQAQHGLGAQARQQNLANAFSLGTSFQTVRPNGSVLLIDDIYTTGATARAAAQALRRYGISVAGVGAIARAIPSAALEQS